MANEPCEIHPPALRSGCLVGPSSGNRTMPIRSPSQATGGQATAVFPEALLKVAMDPTEPHATAIAQPNNTL